MKKWVKVILPFGILFFCLAITVALVKLQKKPERHPVKKEITLVETTSATSQSWTFLVQTQGTVGPRTESALTAEVSGRVLKILPTFYAGGFFKKGDLLLEIDPSNYKSAVAKADFNLAQARLGLAQEEANSKQAQKEWESLSNEKATPLVLRQPQLQSEQANVAWAEQVLEKAKLDLNRTKIRAPYAGIVREKMVDLGQYVTVGSKLGAVFSIDIAEIRLPLSLDQLAFLDLPEAYRGKTQIAQKPKVILSSSIGETESTWTGHLTRTEGVIDTSTRMVYAVAQINDPYGYSSNDLRSPLKMGLFVHAKISGKTVDDVIVLPSLALRGKDQILVVDEENHLRSKTVKIIQTYGGEIVISEGITPGDQVCLTALEFVVEGMTVKVQSDKTAEQEEEELPSIANTEKKTDKSS